MSKKLALYGASLDPSGLHHRRIVQVLSKHFDEVIVFPCGPKRTDKPGTDDTPLVHRAVMADLTFGGIPRTTIDFSDLEQRRFTTTWELLERFSQDEVWLTVGSDLIVGNAPGQSAIQQTWYKGEQLWQEARFAILERPDFPLGNSVLPPQHRIIPCNYSGSSSLIRNLVFNRRSIEGMVTPSVARYIERYNLYRGAAKTQTDLVLRNPKVMVVVDQGNERAMAIAKGLGVTSGFRPNPDLIAVIGGDGTMLRAVRKYWKLRAPFFGINAGHRGFLLNEIAPLAEIDSEIWPVLPSLPELLAQSGLMAYHAPLLRVTTRSGSGKERLSLAFNDAWVERLGGQTAWVQVTVDGRIRLPNLKGDAILISTAAGSTAYALAMGGTPFQVGTPMLLLAGSNVGDPPGWRTADIPIDSVVEFATVDSKKRPLRGYVDSVDQGRVDYMRIQVSTVACCELAFLPDYNLTEKLARVQFPQQ